MRQKLLLLFCFGLFLFANTSFAQDISVTGTVKNEKGEAIPSASVKINGTTRGTLTDEDGQFSINVKEGARLTVSAIGYRDKEVPTSGDMNIILTTVEEVAAGEDVVVTGYTTIAKKNLSSSISEVTQKDIANTPYVDINQVLQGKAAGVFVGAGSGQPGATQFLRIRGIGSISAGAAPLYVVDGIMIDRGDIYNTSGNQLQSNDIMSSLNPNDIESVNILKDAAATSLYGSRGANGVIVITTKKGKAGQSTISGRAQYGVVNTSFGKIKYMTPAQTLQYNRDVYRANGESEDVTMEDWPDSLLDNAFDWHKAAFISANTQDYGISVSGGTDKTQYYTSIGYTDQQGTILGSDLKRFSIISNLTQKVTDRLTFGLNLNLSYTNIQDAGDGGLNSSPIVGSMLSSPFQSPYKPDGTMYTGMEDGFNPLTSNNFLYSSKLNYTKLLTQRAIAQGTIGYRIFDWLSLQEKASVDLTSGNLQKWADPTTLDGFDSKGDLYEANPRQRTFTNQIKASGAVDINADNHLDYALINEYTRFTSEAFAAEGTGFSSGLFKVLDVAATPLSVGGNGSSYSFLAYLGQATYSYKDKYNVTASLRRDGSSRFGVNNKYGTFGSIGASWNIGDEDFMRSQNAISSLKLRASYGSTGNADYDNFKAAALYAYSSSYNGIPGSSPSAIGNPDLSWEKNRQANIGLDIGFIEDRITATIDVYRRLTKDMIFNLPISSTSGFTTQPANIGDMTNKGIELLISSKNIISNNDGFSWTTDLNLSTNQNRVTSLYKNQPIASSLTQTSVGQPVSTWYLKEWAGVNSQTGSPMWYDTNGDTTSDYNAAPRKLLGNSMPKIQGGITNTFAYKGIGLSIFLYGVAGNKIFNQNAMFIDNDGPYFGYQTLPTYVSSFWKKPGDKVDRPMPVPGGRDDNSEQLSSRYLENGSFLRVKNIMLSYNLPEKWLEKAGIKSLKIYAQAANLFTWTGYNGWDPEEDAGANDVFKYPVSKSVTFGVNVTL